MISPAMLYKRWRHGRGFGVHSPMAYHMIHEVIGLRSAAYYHQEAASGAPGGVPRKTVRAIYRLVADRDPRSVVIVCDDSTRMALWHAIISDIVCRCTVTGIGVDDRPVPPADVTIIDTDRQMPLPDNSTDDLKGALTLAVGLSRPNRRHRRTQLHEAAAGGALVIDSLGDMAICVRRADMRGQLIIARL